MNYFEPRLSLTNNNRPPQPILPRRFGIGKNKSKHGKPLRTIAVTSGKGGVGKTNFVVNIAIELAATGKAVTVLDADLALANADILLGLTPTYNIGHVLQGERKLHEVIIEPRQGLKFIPAGSGLEELAMLSTKKHDQLIKELTELEEESDFLLIDTAAGISHNVINMLCAASEVVIVTVPEPTAVVDAYATIKVLNKVAPFKSISMVINNSSSVSDAEAVFNQIKKVSAQFLKQDLSLLGTIPRDNVLVDAICNQVPMVEFAPHMPASLSFKRIAKQLVDNQQPETTENVIPFWGSLLKKS